MFKVLPEDQEDHTQMSGGSPRSGRQVNRQSLPSSFHETRRLAEFLFNTSSATTTWYVLFDALVYISYLNDNETTNWNVKFPLSCMIMVIPAAR